MAGNKKGGLLCLQSSNIFQSFFFSQLFQSVGPNHKSAKAPATTDWKDVDAAMGRAGQDQPDGTHKYALPRKDMNVTVDGVQIKAGLALGSWVAFKATSQGNAMAMGDLVLAEDEVAPVMAELQSGGIEITALHNHLIGETPRVMYMHIHGMGNAASLGKAIHSAIAKTKTPDAGAATAPPDLDIDTKQIDQILGHGGKNNGGIYQVGVPRAEHITEGGMAIPNSMGVATASQLSTDGRRQSGYHRRFCFAGQGSESGHQSVARKWHCGNSAAQPHAGGTAALFFMHFWANDDALKLAKGLRAALDQTNSAKK